MMEKQYTGELREYRNETGKFELRNTIVGQKESQKRREFIESIQPELVNILKQKGINQPNIRITGSVAQNMATPKSDIDLAITHPDLNINKIINRCKDEVINELASRYKAQQNTELPYKIEIRTKQPIVGRLRYIARAQH